MKRRLVVLFILLVVFALASCFGDAGSCENGPAPDVLVIRGGTIHTISGKDILNGTVIVKNGAIAAVGASLAIPPAAHIIDARGLHVYPGMIDAGNNLGLTEIGSVRETSDYAELGDFNPELMAASAINPASEHVAVTRANGITTVLSCPSGGIIAGQAALINLAGWTIDEMAVRRSAAMVINLFSLGRDASAAEAGGSPGRRAAELREFFEKARHYAQALAAEAPALKRDLKLEALVPVIKGDLPALVSVSSARDIRNAIEFAGQEKIKIVLTGADEAWREIDLLKRKDIPVILGPADRWPRREDDPYDRSFTTAAELYKAGIKFAFSTRRASSARDLPYQAAHAAAFGLPPEEALKAITLYPAQILGLKELGSIDAGKMANLIVTDGDPLESRTQVKHLIINGRVTSTENKHTQLYRKYMARP